jgi:hypothetical protein
VAGAAGLKLGVEIQPGKQAHKGVQRNLSIHLLHALQHVIVFDGAVTQAEAPESPDGQFAMVEDDDVLGRMEQLDGQPALDAFTGLLTQLDLDA